MKDVHFLIQQDAKQMLVNSVRMYSTDSVLKAINGISRKLLFVSTEKGIKGADWFHFYAKDEKGRKTENSVLVSGWNLVSLAYTSIIHSNDFRGKSIEGDQELYFLVSILTSYEQEQEKEVIETFRNSPNQNNDILLYIKGFSGEQFKYERPFSANDNAARELYILFDCKPEAILEINVESIIESECHTDWKSLLCCLYFEFANSLVTPFVFDLKSHIKWDDNLSFSDYENVIRRYTSSYKDVRDDSMKIGRQQLYIKPFIKTQKNEVISISPFLNLFLYEHSLLWIVRDYYKRQKKQDFTNAFGCYFEEYVKRLFCNYGIPATKIPEDIKEKRADWVIEVGDYTLLIEQKSALIGLSIKQPTTDRVNLGKYISRNYFEAYKQLENTEKNYIGRECIKIVLTYEDYLIEWNEDILFAMKDCPVVNDGLYWHININEFEMLCDLYANSKERFILLVGEKVNKGKAKVIEGNGIESLLKKYGVHYNNFLHNGTINQYQNIVMDMIEKYTDSKF